MNAMESRILAIFTRTPLHVGAGNSVGAVDCPVMRERHTGFPIIPGSSLKGVLRDHFADLDADQVGDLFGKGGSSGDFTAGKISFGEARVLAFPVRSAKGAFALATCALALRRYARDKKLDIEVPPEPADSTCLAGPALTIERGDRKGVVLEEFKFSSAGEAFPGDWAAELSSLLNDSVLKGATEKFVLLSDGDFAHFTLNACQVNQHVRIDDETGTAQEGGLFNEETVPSETLFYSTLVGMKAGNNNPVFQRLAAEQLIQFGGNGSTGLGFCTVKIV
jgi:CRISPR-associated protein Cmr4